MKILEPLQVANLTFKNRIMFPPLTTGYEERDGAIKEQSFHFYKRLAQGGTGYIVIGDVAPVNTVSPTPKLYDDAQIESFKKLADACHAYDCKLGVQIFYPDYDVPALMEFFIKKDMEGARKKLHYDMLHFIDEVSEAHLQEVVSKIGACAKRAAQAGVDVIQIHGDRLVGSLTSPLLNHRSDKYGGSLENRVRFALDVVKTIKENAPDVCLDYKLPIISTNPQRGKGGLFIEEAIPFAQMLEAAGVQMLHVAQANHTGNMGDTIPAMGCQPYSFFISYAKQIRDAVKIPVSSVGRIVNAQNASALIENDVIDMVGLGRSLLTDPDFANKLAQEKSDEIRLCMMCNKGCTDNIQNRKFLSCVLNAENGYEYKRMITPANTKKKVAVIGGGPAGLEAARVAALKGHDVTLYEKDTRLGGQLNLACIPPRKQEMTRATAYLTHMVKKLGVALQMGREVGAQTILQQRFDSVIVAVGASNALPPIPGHDMLHVLDAWKVLDQQQICSGDVVVIGGGLVGVETAEYLAENNCRVSVVEMLDGIAKEESNTVLPILLDNLKAHDVQLYTNTKVEQIQATQVICKQQDGNELALACDYVVMATGAKINTFDASVLEQNNIDVHFIGDCNEKASNINNAIEQGYLIANQI